jgi:hypothetical protein
MDRFLTTAEGAGSNHSNVVLGALGALVFLADVMDEMRQFAFQLRDTRNRSAKIFPRPVAVIALKDCESSGDHCVPA